MSRITVKSLKTRLKIFVCLSRMCTIPQTPLGAHAALRCVGIPLMLKTEKKKGSTTNLNAETMRYPVISQIATQSAPMPFCKAGTNPKNVQQIIKTRNRKR
jgi:hypothetical protein